ncbi:MAG: nucleotide pyrophosphatase, partial [Cyanobacteria bacterium P01_A01_bin.70]
MGRPLIAIGLDAADPHLIEEWMAAGHLPRLQELREGGVYQRLRTFEYYRAETPSKHSGYTLTPRKRRRQRPVTPRKRSQSV